MILKALAQLYEQTKAARTGTARRDFLVDFEKLLRVAGSTDGDARMLATRELEEVEKAGVLRLERHRRDPKLVLRVRFPQQNEAALYARVEIPSPAQGRRAFSEIFSRAEELEVPVQFRESWIRLCRQYQQAASMGGNVQPFSRQDMEEAANIMRLLPYVLTWRGESFIRFASCVLCGDSKQLELLQPKIEHLLPLASAGKIQHLVDVGIIEKPRSCLVHGSLRLFLNGAWLDLGALQGASQVSAVDIARAAKIDTDAARCLTVENETSFHEIAKLQSGTLLVCTLGYPGSGTIALLRSLPEQLECAHFGDSDPTGFDILRDLRERTGRVIQSLHMNFRPAPKAPPLTPNEVRDVKRLLRSRILDSLEKSQLHAMLSAQSKGRFEQESLGIPNSNRWPFYV